MEQAGPTLRVVRGTPTAAELAALVAVLTARGRAAGSAAAGTRQAGQSRWVQSSRPGHTVGGLPASRGPDRWRDSALPT